MIQVGCLFGCAASQRDLISSTTVCVRLSIPSRASPFPDQRGCRITYGVSSQNWRTIFGGRFVDSSKGTLRSRWGRFFLRAKSEDNLVPMSKPIFEYLFHHCSFLLPSDSALFAPLLAVPLQSPALQYVISDGSLFTPYGVVS